MARAVEDAPGAAIERDHDPLGQGDAEGVGGVSVYEAESMDAAIALAARIPAARLGGAVEIRPAEQYW